LNKITKPFVFFQKKTKQKNNWNEMTIENVINNNRQHPVNTAA
jgi:hypothetical protein